MTALYVRNGLNCDFILLLIYFVNCVSKCKCMSNKNHVALPPKFCEGVLIGQ